MGGGKKIRRGQEEINKRTTEESKQSLQSGDSISILPRLVVRKSAQ